MQRTRAAAVAGFFSDFVHRYSSWRSLAAASERQLKKYLRPIGLWRRRASGLRSLAVRMTARGGRLPRKRVELEELPGVGQYIANAVLTLCHGEREPLLDVNMARVLERYFGPRVLADIRYDAYLQRLAREVISRGDPIVTNWAVLDLAAIVCKPKRPLCASCPVVRGCLYAKATLT